jgi:hypothetical protein
MVGLALSVSSIDPQALDGTTLGENEARGKREWLAPLQHSTPCPDNAASGLIAEIADANSAIFV